MIRTLLLILALSISVPVSASGGKLAEEFTLTDLEGRRHSLSDYRGKWVVVNYWATWCPPCLEEIPELIFFHENHKESDAVVLGVDVEEIAPRRLLAFVDDQMISYPVLPMVDGTPLVGAVPGLPTTYLIDPEGRVVARRVGGVTAEAIESVMAKFAVGRN